jgi:serine/threonine protein kinase
MATGRSSGGKAVGPAIKGYRLIGRLGAGAMGEVYEGVHELIGKKVAVKVLKGDGNDAFNSGQRLIEEARAVNTIAHPGIVDIFDAGTLADGRPYLVMERLEGHSLLEHLKAHKQLPMREVFHLLAGILEPLDAAHRAGVIHRDLKPSNVFLCTVALGLPRVKLVDFGIARRAGREEALTQPLTTLGSLGFMGPEHLAGEVEPASDLYSVGCLAYQMVTGEPVFPVKSASQLTQKHLKETPPPLRARRADAPMELEAWVAWLLEKTPSDRPSTAEVALAVLKEAEAAAAGVGTTPGGPHFGELARAFDRKARAQSAVKPSARAQPLPTRRSRPTPAVKAGPQPGAPQRTPHGTDLMPAFSPLDGSATPRKELEPATLFDEDDDVPAADRPTVLNYKRPDKP